MGIVKLQNVSKFYYSKGIIASGMTKINLDLNTGEFVVITGESGSGKSTLLNVISGLDTYEEGEMYIEGQETSHYTDVDFEEYRQKYISCIFQSFNLISSYTVYQNVALSMQIDGYSAADIRKKVPSIIEKVGLKEYTNRKVSRLSGGQKQRVAIARALAKDTKILVADEPTGNLDSESADDIVRLLTDIASDKLVVVVTHNFDQFKDHATRVIKMHDGKIVDDSGAAKDAYTGLLANTYAGRVGRAQRAEREGSEGTTKKKNLISYGTQLRLGLRNTFNLPAKFLLLLLVFLFVITAISAQYMSVKRQSDTLSEQGWNNYFNNYDPKRVVIERNDKSAFTKADYEALESAPHVDKVIRNDMIYDSSVYIENEEFSFYGYMQSMENLTEEPTMGTVPSKDDEVLLYGYDDGWSFGDDPAALVGKTYTVSIDNAGEHKVKIAGIVLKDINESYDSMDVDTSAIYFTESMMDDIRKSMFATAGTTTLLVNGTEETIYNDSYGGVGGIKTNENVPEGYILMPTSYDSYYKEGYAAGKEVRLSCKTLYYEQTLKLMVMGTYGENTFERKTGLKNLAEHDGEIYINAKDYRRLYERGSYQTSIFVDDTRNMEGMKDMLERGGYRVLVLKDHIYKFTDNEVVSIMQLPLAVVLCIAVFFIAYFVVRLILKSRGVYFATVRMLGMGKGPARRIMKVELVLVAAIAYGLFLLFIYLNQMGIINIMMLSDYLSYLTTRDYVLLATILLVMAVLISGRFMTSIFKSSAMGTYREEA